MAHRMPPLAAARRRSGVRTRVPAPWSRPRPRGVLVDLANARYWIYGQSPLPRGRCVRHPLPARRGEGKARRRMVPASIASVEVDDHGAAQLDFRPVDMVRWETLSLDIGPLDTEQALIDAVNGLAEEALAGSQGRSVVARLELAGGAARPGFLLPHHQQAV